MTKEKIERIHRIYNIVTGAFAVLAGALLMLGCLHIYYDAVPTELSILGLDIPFFKLVGGAAYSREAVAHTFGFIAVPVFFTLLLVLGGFLFSFVSPLKEKKEKAEINATYQIKRLRKKKNLAAAERAHLAAANRERAVRVILTVVLAHILAFCSALFLIYGLNPANFHTTEINDSMIKAMLWLCPFLFLSVGFGIFYEIFCKASKKREIAALKRIPDARDVPEEEKPRDRALLVRRVVMYSFLFAVAFVLIAAGIWMGGTADVLTKAINICTECIGLG